MATTIPGPGGIGQARIVHIEDVVMAILFLIGERSFTRDLLSLVLTRALKCGDFGKMCATTPPPGGPTPDRHIDLIIRTFIESGDLIADGKGNLKTNYPILGAYGQLCLKRVASHEIKLRKIADEIK